MASDKKILASLDIDTKALVKSAQETRQELDKLREGQDKLIAKGKETSAEFVRNDAAIKSLTATYRQQTTAIAAQIDGEGNLLKTKKAIKEAIQEVNTSENAYMENNKQLIALKKQLNVTDDDYEKRLTKINNKIRENNEWLNENGSANAKLITTMADYKDQVSESFSAINIFNGGISGFVSRAQEAGGVGNLFKTSISGMTDGIKGMGAAITANPIGVLLAILGPVLQKIMSFPAVTKAMENAMAALGPIIEMVNKPLELLADGIAWIINVVADFVASSTEAGSAARDLAKAEEELKQAQEALSVAMSVQEEKNAAAKQSIEDLMKTVNDHTKSEKERIAALNEAAAIEKKNLAERKKLADEAYNVAVKKAALGKGLTAEEIADLQRLGAAYAQKLMAEKGFTKEEIDALQKANTARIKLLGEEKNMLQKQEDDRAKIEADGRAKREAAEAAYLQKQQQQRQNNLTLQKLELDKYIADQGTKARTMQEELTIAEGIHKRKLAIIAAEFAASDKSANAKLQHDIALKEADNDLSKQRASAAVDNANKALQAYINANQSKIQEGTLLNDALVQQEKDRLDNIAAQQAAFEETRLKNGVINQEQYDAAIKAITDKTAQDKSNVDAQLKVQKDAQQVADYEIKRANAATQFDQERIEEDQRHQTTVADLKKQRDAGLITEQQYNQLSEQEEKKHSAVKKKISSDEFNNKLDLANQTFGSLQTILGKESAAGKAMAVAQATIDTYKSAVSAYGAMTGIPVVGPALGAVAAAAAVAAGIQNVKKITSTKTPKAEKGALFDIGGKRHSQGGTLFTGEDGTRFEAEKGELIGVMNRNAAQHFMAFNNAFPAGGGSAPNYFASGGIVSREVAQQGLNIDELAAKISAANATMPAPVVAVQDILTQGNSYVKVREAANF